MKTRQNGGGAGMSLTAENEEALARITERILRDKFDAERKKVEERARQGARGILTLLEWLDNDSVLEVRRNLPIARADLGEKILDVYCATARDASEVTKIVGRGLDGLDLSKLDPEALVRVAALAFGSGPARPDGWQRPEQITLDELLDVPYCYRSVLVHAVRAFLWDGRLGPNQRQPPTPAIQRTPTPTQESEEPSSRFAGGEAAQGLGMRQEMPTRGTAGSSTGSSEQEAS